MFELHRKFYKENIKALAVDLDGTSLRPDSVMSERTIQALRACSNRGLAVIISTGRSPDAAASFIDALSVSGPMVFYNGAAVIDMPGRILCASSFLSGSCAAYCVSLARKYSLHFHVFLPDNRLVYDKQRAESDAYEQRTGLRGEETDMAALFPSEAADEGVCIKAMFIADGTALDIVQQELDTEFGSTIYRARSHANFLEVMAGGVSKGAALQKALELRTLEAAATVAFGDAENDLPMADTAAYFYVPENALPAVKKKADGIFPSSQEDGLALFLEAFLL